MKVKITGRSDDLKQVASLLINEDMGFNYDGQNTIIVNQHETSRGFDLTEKLNEYLPSVKANKIDTEIKRNFVAGHRISEELQSRISTMVSLNVEPYTFTIKGEDVTRWSGDERVELLLKQIRAWCKKNGSTIEISEKLQLVGESSVLKVKISDPAATVIERIVHPMVGVD